MLADYDIYVARVLDEKTFFQDLVRFSGPLGPAVALWGSLPEDVAQGLASFQSPVSGWRKLLFREKNYLVTEKNVEAFLRLCQGLNFAKITWGIVVDSTSFVRSKTYGRTGVCSGKRIPSSEVRDLMGQFQAKGIIRDYHYEKGDL